MLEKLILISLWQLPKQDKDIRKIPKICQKIQNNFKNKYHILIKEILLSQFYMFI